MKLSWMGRYRELVRALVYYSNASNKGVIESRRGDDFGLTQHEYQILEYVCEFESDNRIMSDISRDLGIAQSNITKATKTLLSKGYIDRFHMGNNRKSIILKPTDEGKEVYSRMCSSSVAPAFTNFFRLLDGFSEEQLYTLETAIRSLSNNWVAVGTEKQDKLTKIE